MEDHQKKNRSLWNRIFGSKKTRQQNTLLSKTEKAEEEDLLSAKNVEDEEQKDENEETKQNEIISTSITEKMTNINDMAGISLKHLIEFSSDLPENADFNALCSKIKTHTNNCSYTEHLKDQDHVSPLANAFVSYAWSYPVKVCLTILLEQMKNEEKNDLFIWIDVACVNQHRVGELDFNKMTELFGNMVEQIGMVYLVLHPYEKPIIVTRAWCVFEMVVMYSRKVTVKPCISTNEENKLMVQLRNGKLSQDHLEGIFASIDVEKAKAQVESDRISIIDILRKTGIIQVNNIVQTYLRNWFEHVSEKLSQEFSSGQNVPLEQGGIMTFLKTKTKEEAAAMPQTRQQTNRPRITFRNVDNGEETEIIMNEEYVESLHSRGVILESTGKLAEAEPFFRQALERAKAGKLDSYYIRELESLGGVLKSLKRYEEAEPFFREALQLSESINGKKSQMTLSCSGNLGQFLQEKYGASGNVAILDEVQTIYEELVPIIREQLTEHAEDDNCPREHRLEIYVTPMDTYRCDICREQQALGTEMFSCRICDYDECSKCHNPDDQMRPTLKNQLRNNLATLLHNLAYLFHAKHEPEKALKYEEEAIKFIDPQKNAGLLMRGRCKVADLLMEQGQFESAEEIYEQAFLFFSKISGGNESIDSDYSLRQFVNCCLAQKKLEKVDRVLEGNLELRTQSNGANDPQKGRLLEVYSNILSGNLQKIPEVFPLYEKFTLLCIDYLRNHSSDEAKLLDMLTNYGLVLFSTKKMDQAEPIIREAIELEKKPKDQYSVVENGRLLILCLILRDQAGVLLKDTENSNTEACIAKIGQARTLFEDILSRDHLGFDQYMVLLEFQANTFQNLKRFEEAIQVYEHFYAFLESNEKNPNGQKVNFANFIMIQNNIGYLLIATNEFKKAEEKFRQCLTLERQVKQEVTSEIGMGFEKICAEYEKQNLFEEVENIIVDFLLFQIYISYETLQMMAPAPGEMFRMLTFAETMQLNEVKISSSAALKKVCEFYLQHPQIIRYDKFLDSLEKENVSLAEKGKWRLSFFNQLFDLYLQNEKFEQAKVIAIEQWNLVKKFEINHYKKYSENCLAFFDKAKPIYEKLNCIEEMKSYYEDFVSALKNAYDSEEVNNDEQKKKQIEVDYSFALFFYGQYLTDDLQEYEQAGPLFKLAIEVSKDDEEFKEATNSWIDFINSQNETESET